MIGYLLYKSNEYVFENMEESEIFLDRKEKTEKYKNYKRKQFIFYVKNFLVKVGKKCCPCLSDDVNEI